MYPDTEAPEKTRVQQPCGNQIGKCAELAATRGQVAHLNGIDRLQRRDGGSFVGSLMRAKYIGNRNRCDNQNNCNDDQQLQ
jgi:hypothetical protein